MANRIYAAREFVMHHDTDLWGHAVPIDGVRSGIWPTGGAWLTLHLRDRYEFTRDEAFLRVRACSRPKGGRSPGSDRSSRNITVVLRGMVRVEFDGGSLDVTAGQAVVTAPGEWVRYSTPLAGGAEYIAVCLPAFSPLTVHREA